MHSIRPGAVAALLLLLVACQEAGSGEPSPSLDAGVDAAPDPSGDAGTRPPPACRTPAARSACDNEASIARAVVELPPGAEAVTGSLLLGLYHEALGAGSTWGVPHRVVGADDVTLTDGVGAEIHIDHCQNGEMWSEENCGYQLWSFLDVDDDQTLDPGEPAGRVFVELSCRADGPLCERIVLDCTDGPSCLAFADPPLCQCSDATCDGAGSVGRIIACDPPG